MANSYFDLTAGRDFLAGKAKPWLENFVCDITPPALVIPLLLSGIFLKLVELVAAMQGGDQFDIQPINVAVANQNYQLLDADTRGRTRDVSVWVDSASGGPLPTIRISKDGSGAGSGGLRIMPGQVNELGKVPPDTKLFVSATQPIAMYIIVRS